ncbi:hypothetical protein AMS68_007464 [Peltaster fructicola]|uniref:BSD domain-containing protein n=1 Tax=Peltaster fructicola TaxID=286661 RepID=A0A6H0Y4J0_9PEZI|nr:hypothetical protein AMS68_007464 [Peltaster fructicola]
MDAAYDRITDEALAPAEENEQSTESAAQKKAPTLNAEFQEAFKAVSSSPWGATLGGWFGEARKQGQAFVSDLQKEAVEAQGAATKRITGLREEIVKRTGNLSFNTEASPGTGEKDVGDGTNGESKPTDIVKEAGSLVASLRTTAAARFKDLQKAEDAADEALLKFGTNIRDFLREAVIVSAPTDGHSGKRGRDAEGNEVLFETQEPGTGRKIFHTTRLDAQLHAIHSNLAALSADPQGEKWEQWQKDFNIDDRTIAISADLERHTELRSAMEKLVPEKVEYKAFWMRYYFLRSAVEEEEKRRKEVLKGAAVDGEEVAWDDDDDDEGQSSTPNADKSASTTTLNAPTDNNLLKPAPRKSHDEENKSVADSEASYDIVSGATSRAPGSPKEKKANGEESDDDWE